MPYTPTTTPDKRSLLASLRSLVPQRPLTPSEVLRVTELQANHLLRHFQIETSAVPEEILDELPRIQVIRQPLPVSGAAYWNGRYWIIALNADEPFVRQRFSLMHEFKHVLDHTTKDHLYHDRFSQSAHEQAERVADYFAACVLMPKRIVKSLWCTGHQNIPALAAKLQVSVPALRYRLTYLGLTEPGDRCEYRPGRAPSSEMARRHRYLRQSRVLVPVGGPA